MLLEHRFREFYAEPVAATVMASTAAFVPCPCMVVFAPAHQAYVADVYRIAREMTEAQLRKPARSRIPAFSLN